MNGKLAIALLVSCCLLPSAGTLQAGIIGTAIPYLPTVPDTLGPYDMTLFSEDTQPIQEFVTDVPSPLGGEVAFSPALYHTKWNLAQWWSPPPDCYMSIGESVTLTLPEGTRAFSFYVGTDTGSIQGISITADDETSVEAMIDSYATPVYVGFYVDDPAETIIAVTVPFTFSGEVGVFSIAVPEPATICLLAPLLLMCRRRST